MSTGYAARPRHPRWPDVGPPDDPKFSRWLALLLLGTLIFLLGFLAGTVHAAEACVISVDGVPAFMQPRQRYGYTVRVRVRPHAEHRLLVLAWDSPAHAGSSSRELGADAAVTWTFPQRDMPGGRYLYVASVFDQRGTLLGQATTTTILAGDDDGAR